jgi:hypothetical protein
VEGSTGPGQHSIGKRPQDVVVALIFDAVKKRLDDGQACTYRVALETCSTSQTSMMLAFGRFKSVRARVIFRASIFAGLNPDLKPTRILNDLFRPQANPVGRCASLNATEFLERKIAVNKWNSGPDMPNTATAPGVYVGPLTLPRGRSGPALG